MKERSTTLVLLLFMFLVATVHAARIAKLHPRGDHKIIIQSDSEQTQKNKSNRAGAQQVAGSRLPDCSHACGSCTPCRLVTVSFVCSSLEEAETCPMAYKCMCHNKSYPVP